MEKAEPSVTRTPNPAELFETQKLSVERLPQLRSMFERISSGCVEDFKDLFTAPISCFLNQVEAGDSWDILDAYEDCIASLFYVSQWDVQILIALERRLVYAAIDAMFGSDGSEPPIEGDDSYTNLELQIAKELCERTASCLQVAMAPLAEISVAFERIETKVEFNILGPQDVPSIFAQLLFQIYDSGGRMIILVPRAPLMPLRKKLERGTLRVSQADDPRWTKQLQNRVATTQVNIRAVVKGPSLTLKQICDLEVGQVLPLDALSGPEVVLESASTPVFKCSLGQLEGSLSVKIDSAMGQPRGLTENVLLEAMNSWPTDQDTASVAPKPTISAN